MFIRKKKLSVEQQHEVAGRCFNKEYQVSLAKYYGVCQKTICIIVQRYDKDAQLKVQALASASLFYDKNPDLRPDGARSSTHPAYSGGRNVIQAIQLPQQVPAFTSSFTVPPGISMQPADLNVPGVRVFPSGKAFTASMAPSTPPAELIGTGAIRFVPGQAFTSRLAWTVLQAQHQAPALPYVHAGQNTLLACTSQGQSEFHRPGGEKHHSAPDSSILSKPPVELNGTGAIRFVQSGQAFISRPAWTVLQAQPHQAPALQYVHAGQETLLACTSQGQSELHRPGASHSPVNGNPCVAPPNSTAAGNLLSS